MGVPKFFRYISERYPCLSELAREQCIPEFDNLYLDMNGIIHNCSHPDDNDLSFSITEDQIFKDIFNYIDKLIFLIKPQKLFFMAVDGVAPRAKMNQQRSRRFRSAKDAELLEKKAQSMGHVREQDRFDSNCITPGTSFMARLQEALKSFVKRKISTDPIWQKCRVILSGHDCPGEGEHKIMDYIRYMKSQKDYDPNIRHCLYGLDADLIILGLCTHELHFVVLREEVKFGRKTKRASVEATRFFLLHLGLFREYMELEFDQLRKIDTTFDIANMIDDWVLMGFLVGNDFIPHLPCLHINSDALPLLYKTYIEVYPTLGGNINENGKLNLERLEKYFNALSVVELNIFQENYYDLKYLETKQTKNGIDEAFDFDINEIKNDNTETDLAELIENTRLFLDDDSDESVDENQRIAEEFETHKRNYYTNKLNQDGMSSQVKHDQAICYITALQWILDYYYCGVQSWDWYYPHHYAPFISDLKDFKNHKIVFNLGKPFLPFEQLLAVLPAGSKNLLPVAYQDLMTNPESEVVHFYPDNFETDLNGKKHEWEAVVLIPFIDEKLLLKAMKTCEGRLSLDEIKRNKHGPMLQYEYNSLPEETAADINLTKTNDINSYTVMEIWSKDIAIPRTKTVCVELPNAARNVFFPGFPTMKHLNFDFELKHSRVKVFDQPSRGENLILKPLQRKGFDDLYTVAQKYLGQIVYIGWPHLIKAKVFSISNSESIIYPDGIKKNEQKIYQYNAKFAQEHFLNRMGIELDDVSVILQVRTHIGTTYVHSTRGKVIQNDVWSPKITNYPAQCIVSEIAVHKNACTRIQKIEDILPKGSLIFYVGKKYYGSEGRIVDPMPVYECERVTLRLLVYQNPDFTEAKLVQTQLQQEYVNSYTASTIIGISSNCLGRITGTLLVVAGVSRPDLPDNMAKSNIGLQLKFPKHLEERAGYARRFRNQWFYSSKAIELIKNYYDTYPMVFEYLSSSSDRSEYIFESDLFPDNVGEKRVEDITNWIKAQEYTKADRIASGSETVEKEAVEMILKAIDELKKCPHKDIKLQVKPIFLLKPDTTLPLVYKSNVPIKLFDRIVIVKTTYMVPIGARGTVIGIYPVTDPNPVRLECLKTVDNFYEILFDDAFPNGNDIYGLAAERVYKVPETSLLLIIQEESLNGSKTMDNSTGSAELEKQYSTNYVPTNNKTVESSKNVKSESLQQTQKEQYSNQSTNISTFKERSNEFWIPTQNTKTKPVICNNLNQPFGLTASNMNESIKLNKDLEPKKPEQILQPTLAFPNQSTLKQGSSNFWNPTQTPKSNKSNPNAIVQMVKEFSQSITQNTSNQNNLNTASTKPQVNQSFHKNTHNPMQQEYQTVMPQQMLNSFTQNNPSQSSTMNNPPLHQIKEQNADCNTETLTLKSLLGIKQESFIENPLDNSPFKQLPQPPICWKNEASNVNCLMWPQQSIPRLPLGMPQHLPTPSFFGNFGFNRLKQPCFPNANLPFGANMHNIRVKNPYLNSIGANQSSAFIPLQAMRGKGRASSKPEVKIQKNIDTEQTSEVNNPTPIVPNEEPKVVEKKMRKPKIAAKFDNL